LTGFFAVLLWGFALVPASAQYLLVAEQGANQIRKLSPSGGDLGVFAGFSTDPVAIRRGANGDIYVAGQDPGGAFRFAADGTFLNFFSIPQGFVGWDIGFAQNGDVLIADAGNGSIWRHTPDGTFQGVFASGLGTITGLLEMPNGDFLVADALHGIRRISSNGASLGDFSTVVTDPGQMVMDNQGNILVTRVISSGSIHRLSSVGGDLSVFTPNLEGSWGLIEDDNNGFLVSLSQASGPNRIRKIGADGTDLGSFTSISLNSPEGMVYVVPEPATGVVLVFGIGLALYMKKRKR
jgi:streptogramin lyase